MYTTHSNRGGVLLVRGDGGVDPLGYDAAPEPAVANRCVHARALIFLSASVGTVCNLQRVLLLFLVFRCKFFVGFSCGELHEYIAAAAGGEGGLCSRAFIGKGIPRTTSCGSILWWLARQSGGTVFADAARCLSVPGIRFFVAFFFHKAPQIGELVISLAGTGTDWPAWCVVLLYVCTDFVESRRPVALVKILQIVCVSAACVLALPLCRTRSSRTRSLRTLLLPVRSKAAVGGNANTSRSQSISTP